VTQRTNVANPPSGASKPYGREQVIESIIDATFSL
jgi:hypothetical protein